MSARSLDLILARPDISTIAEGIRFSLGAQAATSFQIDHPDHVTLAASAFDRNTDSVAIVRHAIELCIQLRISPEHPVLAGLIAARVAACFQAIAYPVAILQPPLWHATMVAPAAPNLTTLCDIWRQLRDHLPGSPVDVSPDTAAQLAAVWPILGPTETLSTTGGDTRLHIDPLSGLNTYGCGPRPRPWAITFASSTASSISERGYAAAEKARRRLFSDSLKIGIEASEAKEAERIRKAIGRHYELSEQVSIFIVPSGTDGELLALGVALAGDPSRPLTNVLVGPDESGSGVPLAAAGCHFSTQTAWGISVSKGERIAGIPSDLEVASVAVRTAAGAFRPESAIMADCVERAADAIARNRRVLFHILDLSKTGLLAPVTSVPVWPDHRDKVDLIVDASQARLGKSSVQSYLANDAMVLLTGSKFFTGPPFAGALLVPASLAHRLETEQSWPSGFVHYFKGRHSQDDQAPPAPQAFRESVSFGLALRWQAALAEMEAFSAIDETVVVRILQAFRGQVEAGIKANPDLYWHETKPLARPGFQDCWDRLPSIFSFSIWQPDGAGAKRRMYDVAEARKIYTWLNCDLSQVLPKEFTPEEKKTATQIVHIGQPVALADPEGNITGALRISVGARLISGEPSHAHLDLEDRIGRELSDVLTVLAKVSLIVKYFATIQEKSPQPRFQ